MAPETAHIDGKYVLPVNLGIDTAPPEYKMASSYIRETTLEKE